MSATCQRPLLAVPPVTPWLDIHVLLSSTTDPTWVRRCKASLNEAIEVAGFPIALHFLPAVPGHVGQARQRGYAVGHAPYVTHVDDDDWVAPHAFSIMKPHLDGGVDVLFPQEIIVNHRKVRDHFVQTDMTLGRQRHSLVTFKRQYLIDHTVYRWASDAAQLEYLLHRSARRIDVRDPVYFWRVYGESPSTALRLAYPEELTRARQRPAS